MKDQNYGPSNHQLRHWLGSLKFPDIADAALEPVLAAASNANEIWRYKSYAERAQVIANSD